MNRVEIIAIGNEILSGRVLDSNSNRLAQTITSLGGEMARCVAMQDRTEDISSFPIGPIAVRPQASGGNKKCQFKIEEDHKNRDVYLDMVEKTNILI